MYRFQSVHVLIYRYQRSGFRLNQDTQPAFGKQYDTSKLYQ